jgi:hypothetical protein
MAFTMLSWFSTLRQQTPADFQWMSTEEIENNQRINGDIETYLEE